ncbi:PREDICTED: sperm-egg fusion protein Juno-like [Chinchilla lanigera]|uniref:sperm-egg fusion protein Juno-like n=1 Tax=Chinchilla lanigera TaxID=34839 RepID=UPI00069899B4|nr:PREDICTED: sperm-egg fusion protein Juno-like [Chinchilla lanigera]
MLDVCTNAGCRKRAWARPQALWECIPRKGDACCAPSQAGEPTWKAPLHGFRLALWIVGPSCKKRFMQDPCFSECSLPPGLGSSWWTCCGRESGFQARHCTRLARVAVHTCGSLTFANPTGPEAGTEVREELLSCRGPLPPLPFPNLANLCEKCWSRSQDKPECGTVGRVSRSGVSLLEATSARLWPTSFPGLPQPGSEPIFVTSVSCCGSSPDRRSSRSPSLLPPAFWGSGD